MIWLLFITTVFGPEVVHHRIPVRDWTDCRALARSIPVLLETFNEPIEIQPGVWVLPRMVGAFPRVVCRPGP